MLRTLFVSTLLTLPAAVIALPTQQEIVEAHGADRLYEVEEITAPTFSIYLPLITK